MTGRPDISIVIPAWNTRELVAQCLDSVMRTSAAVSIETTVVDNASTDGTDQMVGDRFPSVRLLRNEQNCGFARAANRGMRASSAPYVLFLNSDAQLLSGTLAAMLAVVQHTPRAAIVGALLRNLDGTLQSSYGRFPTLGREFLVLSGVGRLLWGTQYPSGARTSVPTAVDWVSGACMLARRSAFEAVSGFDEGYFMYAEDVDLCYRLRQHGWEVWFHPAAHATHLGAASSATRPFQREADLYRSRVRFFRTHYGQGRAAVLVLAMCALTAVKIPINAVTRRLSGGRYGRPVVPLRQLAAALRNV